MQQRLGTSFLSFAAATATVLFSAIAHADEGMWVYNNLPLAQIKERYGFTPDNAWINRVMKASVRFNSGGSGSFVSATGLVITNHHVASDTLYKLSTADNNILEKGFYAKTQAEEIKTPDLELNQLVSIEDVTAKVKAAVSPNMTAAEAAAAKRKIMGEIEKESLDKTGLRSDVITLYQGGQYALYRFKKYTDVRLVFAPESAIAFFGGDPDNFEFPRFDLDICIFRVYEDGKPAQVEHFFPFTTKLKEGELVFVSGNPGRTSRLFTMDALQFQRDVRMPMVLDYLRRLEIMLQQYGQEGKEQQRRAKDDLFGVQNSRKAYTGMLQGLQDPTIIAEKKKAETSLRAKIAADPKLAPYAYAFDKIRDAQQIHAKIIVENGLWERGQAFNSTLFGIARTLVRLAEEDQKPSAERLREFRDSARASLEQDLFSPAPIYPDLEEVRLADALAYMVEKLGGENDMVKKILNGKSPRARAAELVTGTKLADIDTRKALAKGGKEALAKADDAMIELAQLVDPTARAIRKEYEDKVQEVEQQAYAQIAEAIFATAGPSQYPDATFSLRLSFGRVLSYQEGGKKVAAMTTLGGAFEHEAVHGGVEPWKLPATWTAAKESLDLTTPFNFVNTCDIIGGNSGSPTFNRAGEFVGIIFDGNIQSLTADYIYSDREARAVSVHAAAIIETLKKVYKTDSLVAELMPAAK